MIWGSLARISGLLYCGGVGIYLSPISFLKDPTIWFEDNLIEQGNAHAGSKLCVSSQCTKFKELLKRNKVQVKQKSI